MCGRHGLGREHVSLPHRLKSNVEHDFEGSSNCLDHTYILRNDFSMYRSEKCAITGRWKDYTTGGEMTPYPIPPPPGELTHL